MEITIAKTVLLAVLAIIIIAAVWLKRVLQTASVADWGNSFANHIDGLNRLFVNRYHRLPKTDLDLPEQGPAIVVANHISGIDAFLLLASSRRPLHFLIAEEQYKRPGFKWLLDLSGCIPVEKTTRPERALRQALRALKEGKVIALFPFGRMHLDSEPPIKIKGGVAVLAARSGTTIYPCRIEKTAVRKEVMTAITRRGNPRLFPLDPIEIHEDDTPREILNHLAEVLSTPVEEAT